MIIIIVDTIAKSIIKIIVETEIMKEKESEVGLKEEKKVEVEVEAEAEVGKEVGKGANIEREVGKRKKEGVILEGIKKSFIQKKVIVIL
jgi:hypothetical protein